MAKTADKTKAKKKGGLAVIIAIGKPRRGGPKPPADEEPVATKRGKGKSKRRKKAK